MCVPITSRQSTDDRKPDYPLLASTQTRIFVREMQKNGYMQNVKPNIVIDFNCGRYIISYLHLLPNYIHDSCLTIVFHTKIVFMLWAAIHLRAFYSQLFDFVRSYKAGIPKLNKKTISLVWTVFKEATLFKCTIAYKKIRWTANICLQPPPPLSCSAKTKPLST